MITVNNIINKDSFIGLVQQNENVARLGADYYSYETLESFQAKLG